MEIKIATSTSFDGTSQCYIAILQVHTICKLGSHLGKLNLNINLNYFHKERAMSRDAAPDSPQIVSNAGWIHHNKHHISMVSCQKVPTRHAYAWQIGPSWQDTLDMSITNDLFPAFLAALKWYEQIGHIGHCLVYHHCTLSASWNYCNSFEYPIFKSVAVICLNVWVPV